jgi:hypothetical protein
LAESRQGGGNIASDAGGLLLRETEKRTGIMSGFAKCFEDLRNPDLIEHTVAELVAQRVYGLALGYEDRNDDFAVSFELGSFGAAGGS